MEATARAHSNIALVKYWGKRDETLVLPMHGSVSLTLDALSTTTTVRFAPHLQQDVVVIDDAPASPASQRRVSAFLDRVRQRSGTRSFAEVVSHNTMPVGSGLASSASAFAALAAAAVGALGLELSPTDLSKLARQGSGSACRSIYPGFVEWRQGERPDGEDSYAVPLHPGGAWDVRCLMAVVSDAPKPVSSREGMRRTVETSPLYASWLSSVPRDLAAVRQAVATRNFSLLGETAERNALKMHATALAAEPPIFYWRQETVAAIEAVWALRNRGVPAYFTIDAGPNLAVLCQPSSVDEVARALRQVPGVTSLISAKPGPGVELLKGR
ncbi:MAG: diphosphomevalonate decarboxylase [Alicyclobacillus sp.]|nr:diphosphomevalonate decarboxylase [Alicyclobacillus sp.]